MRLGFGVTGVGNCSLIRSSSRVSVNFAADIFGLRSPVIWIFAAKFGVSGRVENLNSMHGGLDSWRVSADTEGPNSQYRVTEKPNKSLFGFFLHVISPKDAS